MNLELSDLVALACLSVSLGGMLTMVLQSFMSKEVHVEALVSAPSKSSRPFNVDFNTTYKSLIGRAEVKGKLMDHRKVQEVLMSADAAFVEETRYILSSSSYELDTIMELEGLTQKSEEVQRWI